MEWRQFRNTDYYVSQEGKIGHRISENEYFIRKTPPDPSGYPKINFRCDGKITTRTIHSMVAEVWHGFRPEGKHINHKDGVKTNNHPSNLEYVTRSENQLHALKMGLCGAPPGSGKLTEEQVRSILRSPLGYKKLAKKYEVCRSTIQGIKKRQIWKWVLINKKD